MATNFEVRVLLELWNFADTPISRGTLNGCVGGSTQTANETRASLVQRGYIEALPKSNKISKTSNQNKAEGDLFRITEAGKAELKKSLVNNKFQFDKVIGARTANVLLKWWRSQPKDVVMVADQVETIKSYEAFKAVALETFDRLNKEYCHGGLVPIWQAREEIGTAVSRTQFNDWIMKMQAEQIFYLQSGEAIGATDAQKRDSIENEIRGLLFYISQPD